jgi:hypothetical protein
MRPRIGAGCRLVFALAIAALAVSGCRTIDPAWVADADFSPSKTSRLFVGPPSRVGPAMLLALDDLGVRVDNFQVRDSEQGTIVDLDTTREDQRRPGAEFRNSEILREGTQFANGIVGPDLLDGEVKRADGRTLRFSRIEAIFTGKTPDNRTVVATTHARSGSTAVNVSVGGLGDPALCRALFSGIETHLSAAQAPRTTPN